MSLDSEPSPPPVHRDWFFPSAPFVHTAPSARTLNPRRPSVFPSTTRASKPFLREPRSQRAAPGSTFSSLPAAAGGGAVTTTSSPPLPSSIRRRDSRYAGVRRKVCFDAPTPDKTARTDGPQAARDYKPAVRKGAGVFFDGRVRFRWPMAVSVAIIVTCFTSLLHKNFSLHNQLIVLQDQLSMLNARLQACDIFPPLESSNIVSQEGDHILNRKLKNSALFFSLAVLSIALITFKHIDNISRLRMPADTEAVSLSKELAYRVDVFLSVQPYAKPLALFLATFLLICLGGLALFGVTDDSLADCLWLSWTYVADSGNHANSVGIGPKLVSVSISFGGMLIFAMMLGLVSDTISEKFDSLRKGRSKVIEKNHTLILGWSDKLGSLLNQLAIANESLGGGTVVVMAERDKEEMELDISKMEFDFKGTSVICRSGSPLILADLKKVSVSKARAVVVLAEDGNADQIWEDILGFENCEFYIKRWPQLDEMQFEDVLISFPDAIPCGIKVASSGGKIILNPDDSYVLQEGDEILVIAEDDDSYAPTTLPMVHRGYLPKDFIVPKSPERILFCGWRRDMEDMIMVLDAFLAPESELWMFNDVAESEREKKLIDGGLDFSRLENITLVNREGNAVIRRHLESLPLESFDSILILADESVEDSAIQADSRSLATLLLIRDIQAKRLPYKEAMVSHVHRGSFSQGSWIGEMRQASDKSVIISEILDPRTKNLLSMSKISDYVLSNELVSMALAMVAEDRQINDVLEELFAEEGNELQIRPADLYLHEEEEMNFYEIMVRARQRKEIVIGYRLANAEQAIINPPDKSVQRKWSCKDVFVVIAEKE
ncbi:probable ion channel CASTOR isoform X4 [Phoenix dactylifera]|uniref:Probable ion channel CASTOR isoform X4 n=1 Tax=Phoenix dactylifera TaxID=42345 RepID=A0A8B8ZA96_PHODC|nr:probable ion channel CASTOR isoform X4 [Phoenix dactylifera]